MAIPAGLKALIAQVRQQHPQLKGAPDELVAQLILQALADQEGAAAPQADETDLESMSAEQCGSYGERLLNTGRWQEAERFFFAALEKAERAGDLDIQCKVAGVLGRLCRQR